MRLKIKDVTASLIVDRSIFSIFYWSIDRSCFKTNIMSLCVYVCMCSHMLLKATNATQLTSHKKIACGQFIVSMCEFIYYTTYIHTNNRTKSFQISNFSFQFYFSLNQFKLFLCGIKKEDKNLYRFDIDLYWTYIQSRIF